MIGIKAAITASLFVTSAIGIAQADLGHQQCISQTIPIYFAEGTSAISPHSRTLLEFVSEELALCQVEAVQVEASASSAINQNRSESLERALVELGVSHKTDIRLIASDLDPQETFFGRQVNLNIVARSQSQS
ncbi:MAG: hypothetical protein AAFX02_05130 [Pseudomonadota bacterium]